jgi:hypothetical protein
MRTRAAVGIIVGGVTDILATNVFTLPLMIYIGATGDFAGVPTEQMGARAISIMQGSSSLQIAGWMLGLSATILGGYVAARIARADEVRHGAFSAWLCMSLGVYALFSHATPAAPMWQHLLALVLAPTFGALGGLLRKRQIDRDRDDKSLAPQIVAG